MSASKWKPYPAYKSTNETWIPSIPINWDIKPLQFVFEEKKWLNKNGEENNVLSLSYGKIIRRDISKNFGLLPASFNTYNIVNPESIILRLTDLQNDKKSLRVGIVKEKGIITSAYLCIKSNSSSLNRYGYLLLHAFDLTKIFYAIGDGVRQSMGYEQMRKLSIAIPSKEEREKIIRFCGKIDSTIQSLIESMEENLILLEEKRSALIKQAVSKGLNPGVPMKDSGIDWIGEIPEHWVVKRMKQITNEVTAGPFGSSLTKAMYVKSGYRVYGQEQVIADDFSIGDYYISNQKFDEMQRYQVKEDDILVSAIGTIGRVSVFPREAEEGIFNPRLVRYAVNKEMIKPYFLKHLLLSDCSQIYFNLSAGGTTMRVLNLQIIGETPLLIPPISEQNEITMYIEGKNKLIENYNEKITSKIEKLKEYRTALISAAVTGKIDVQ